MSKKPPKQEPDQNDGAILNGVVADLKNIITLLEPEAFRAHLPRRYDILHPDASNAEAMRWAEGGAARLKKIRELTDALVSLSLSKTFSATEDDPVLVDGSLSEDQRTTIETIRALVGNKLPPGMRWTEGLETLCSVLLERLYFRNEMTWLFSGEAMKTKLAAILEQRNALKLDGNPVQPCTVVVCDLNKFKEYNSYLGTQLTDKVLVGIAGLMREHANRWGDEESVPLGRSNLAGDEFCFIMPCGAEEASKRMSELNHRLHDTQFAFKDAEGAPHFSVLHPTMSYGCYELDSERHRDPCPDTAEIVFRKAEMNMQAFKDHFSAAANDMGFQYPPQWLNHDNPGKSIGDDNAGAFTWALFLEQANHLARTSVSSRSGVTRR